jgi:UDP-N-acetylmuramoyl-L-alanyl-D-glutamate--2,6-diaminopimelate ligase
MSSYFEAKAQLFTRERVHLAVVNRADPWGARLVERLTATGPTMVTFAPEDAADVELSPRRASFTWRGRRFELNMGGRFNVANALAAATTARELGVGWDAVTEGLASLAPVKGRFQAVDEGQSFTVLVDFAHTPAALAELLRAARDLARDADPHVGASTVSGPDLFAGPGDGRGRVILVFGAGGDRDRAKRPLMGHVAGRLADVVVITSDNPRSEEPLAIIDQVASGVKGGEGVGKVAPWVEVDRAQAIAGAIGMARKGDVLVVAGKGHETGQDFGTHVLPFDDVEVARLALRSRRVSGHAGDDGGSHAGGSGSHAGDGGSGAPG